MAQVIRKYNIGGNLDEAPVLIDNKYYMPTDLREDIRSKAEQYIQNKGLSGEFASAFRSYVGKISDGLIAGQISVGNDGKLYDKSRLLSNSGSFSSGYNKKKWKNDTDFNNDVSVEATNFIYGSFINNKFNTREDKDRYEITAERILGDDIESFITLDDINATTGLRGFTNRKARLIKGITDEINRLKTDPKYRRSFNFYGSTGSDVNTGWSTRHHKAIKDLEDILNRVQDEDLNDEDLKYLSSLGFGDYFYTGEGTPEAREIAAAYREQQEREAAEALTTRMASNALNFNILGSSNNKYGYGSSSIHFNGEDYPLTWTLPEGLNESIYGSYFQSLMGNTYNNLKETLYNGDNSQLREKYVIDITDIFNNDQLNNTGSRIIKVFSNIDDPDNSDYMFVDYKGDVYPASLALDDGIYNLTITTHSSNNTNTRSGISLGSINPDGTYSKFIMPTETTLWYEGPKKGYSRGDYYYIPYDDKIIKVPREKFKNVKGRLVYGQSGLKFRSITSPSSEKNSDLSITTLMASLSSEENNFEEFISGQDLITTDYVRLGGAMADVASMGLGFVPGGSGISAVVGGLGSLAELGSDFADKWTDREGAQGYLSMLGEFGLNIGMDLVSLLPGGKSLKAAKGLETIVRYVPHIAGLIQAGYIIANPEEKESLMNTINKLKSLEFSKLNTKDYNNIAFIGRSLMGMNNIRKQVQQRGSTKTEGYESTATARVGDKDYKVTGQISSDQLGWRGTRGKQAKKAMDESLTASLRTQVGEGTPLDNIHWTQRSNWTPLTTTSGGMSGQGPSTWFNGENYFLSDKWFVDGKAPWWMGGNLWPRTYWNVQSTTSTEPIPTTVKPESDINSTIIPNTLEETPHITPPRSTPHKKNKKGKKKHKQGGVLKYQSGGNSLLALSAPSGYTLLNGKLFKDPSKLSIPSPSLTLPNTSIDPFKEYNNPIDARMSYGVTWDPSIGKFTNDITFNGNKLFEGSTTLGTDTNSITENHLTPDYGQLLGLSELALKSINNYKQRELARNFKYLTKTPLQLNPEQVTGNYNALRTAENTAGAFNTLPPITSDARLDVASRLTGVAQGEAAKFQGNILNAQVIQQSRERAEAIARQNSANAVTTANENSANATNFNNSQAQFDINKVAANSQSLTNYLTESRNTINQNKSALKQLNYKFALDEYGKAIEEEYKSSLISTFLTRAKAAGIIEGTDIEIVNKYLNQNPEAYAEAQEIMESIQRKNSPALKALQEDLYKIDPLFKWNTTTYTDRLDGTGLRSISYNKRGGSIKDKEKLQRIKDYNKQKLSDSKENAKTLRESNREFYKTMRALSAGALALLKKAME